MRRLHAWSGHRGIAACCRNLSTSRAVLGTGSTSEWDQLNELFSELEGVRTSSGVKAKSDGSPSARDTSRARPSRKEEESNVPPVKSVAAKTTLEQALSEAKEEERELLAEHHKVRREKGREEYRPVPPARTFLSTGEMIADKAPQHFVASEESLEDIPELQESGSVAVVSLVGNVREKQHPTPSEEVVNQKTETVFDLRVAYTMSFLAGRRSEVMVRCVGDTLAAFARDHIKVGDVVHVLGHLLPPAEDTKGCSLVYVLPVGGNVSVVARLPQ